MNLLCLALTAVLFQAAFLCDVAQAVDVPPEPAASTQFPPRIAEGVGKSIEVRPLDDEENPYRDKYRPWDRWLYENWTPAAPQPQASEPYDPHRQPQAHVLVVDAAGFVIPLLETWHGEKPKANTLEGIVTRDREALEAARPETYAMWVFQPLPADLHQQYEVEHYRDQAEQLPPIPAWLGEVPPLLTVFVPNGEILCYGELGLRYQFENPMHAMHAEPGETWYRYDAQGHLLGSYTDTIQVTPGSSWNELYFADLPQRKEAWTREGLSTIGVRGYTVVVRREAQEKAPEAGKLPRVEEVVAAYDYSGQPVDYRAELPLSSRIGSALPFAELEKIYRSQLAFGLTDSAKLSPYEGRSEGPQRTDTAVRPKPYLVIRDTPAGRSRIKVRPLDDPQNPYRSEYTEWDRWQYSALGQIEPEAEAQYQQRIAEWDKAHNAALRNKTPFDLPNPRFQGIADDPHDDWFLVRMLFDAQGYLLPMARAEWHDGCSRGRLADSAYTLADGEWYLGFGGGRMDPVQRRAYENYHWSSIAAHVPHIPAWLTESPVDKAVLRDNGEVVTLGPLGSGDGEIDYLEAVGQEWPDEVWYRYSADGTLLAQGAAGRPWAQFYSPALATIEQRAADNGWRLVCIDELVFLREPSDNIPVECYDWLGQPLDFSTDLFDDSLDNEVLGWETLLRVQEVRAAETADR